MQVDGKSQISRRSQKREGHDRYGGRQDTERCRDAKRSDEKCRSSSLDDENG